MDHKEMDVWKTGMILVEKIYELIAEFPREEKYGLASQMKRAAVSIPSNIAEGAARKSNKEFGQFISISLGSLAELETQYLLAIRLRFIDENSELNEMFESMRRLLIGTRNYLNK